MSARNRNPKSLSSWPIVWRVVAPAAGSRNRDMMMLQTDDEREARKRYGYLRRGGWPVRIECVQCGPLPEDARPKLAELRVANGQAQGQKRLPAIAGYWTHGERKRAA